MDPEHTPDVLRYLRQQKEQFGDILFLDRKVTPVPIRTDGHDADPQNSEDASLDTHDMKTSKKWLKSGSLDELNAAICQCTQCPLGLTRTNFVFGVGNPNADLVVIGEAPGSEEDARGEPFVGRAGQLLNSILEAVHFKREEVFICNILKCRPPKNRDPLSSEVEQCEPYLHKQLELLQPKIILALGRIAAQTLLRTSDTLGSMRAKTHEYQGIPLFVTFHPAALLRNPNWKRPTWEDVQKLRSAYDEIILKNNTDQRY